MAFTRYTDSDIVISTNKVVTSTWTNNTNNLTIHQTSSIETSFASATSSGQFFINVFNLEPDNNDNAEVQYAVAYGNKVGSGSPDFTNDTGSFGVGASRTIYNQYRQLVFGDETQNFTFDSHTPDDIYVININRSRFKHALKPGTLNLTELYLTLHRGTKDFSFDGTSSKNDNLSISTFEIDANISPVGNNLTVNNFIDIDTPDFYTDKNGNEVPIPTPVSDDNPVGSISFGGDRKIDLFLKNDPKVRPAFHQLIEDDKRAEHCTTVQTTLLEFVQNNPGNPGSNSLLQTSQTTEEDVVAGNVIPPLPHGGGIDPFFIVERTKCFDSGPGSPTRALLGPGELSGSSAPGFIGSEIIVKNTNNYSGSQDNGYHIQLSFLDKAHALVLNIDKQTELFDGIGSRGVVLIPELTEQLVKDNVDYYLRKGGVISRKTIKAPRRPEKGR